MEKKRGIKITVIGCGSSASLDAIKHVNSLNLNPVIKCQCGHLLDERFPSELINKKCGDCGGCL